MAKNPCKYYLKDGRVLSYDEMRQYLLENYGDIKKAPKPDATLESMTSRIEGAGVIMEYLSGETIYKRYGETPTNDQSYEMLSIEKAGAQGRMIVQEAQKKYGSKFVPALLEYAKREDVPTDVKALIYVSLENELHWQSQSDPQNAATLNKLKEMVRVDSQAFARTLSKGMNLYRLRDYIRHGMSEQDVVSRMFTKAEYAEREQFRELASVKPQEVNKVQDEYQSTKAQRAKERLSESPQGAKKSRAKTAKAEWKAQANRSGMLDDLTNRLANKIKNLGC